MQCKKNGIFFIKKYFRLRFKIYAKILNINVYIHEFLYYNSDLWQSFRIQEKSRAALHGGGGEFFELITLDTDGCWNAFFDVKFRYRK